MRVDGVEGYPVEIGFSRKPLSTDWMKYEMVLKVPEDSLSIYFGFTLNGDGQLWGDDFRLEVVDDDVRVTAGISSYREQWRKDYLSKPEEERARLTQQEQENAKKLPLKPVNLDFEQ